MDKISKVGTPTVFVVNSPFQALCAFEAIGNFCIKNYLFVLPIFVSPRNKQLFQLLEDRKVPFIVERLDQFYFRPWLKSIIKRKYFTYSIYHRAFIGDEESVAMRFCAYKYLAPCSTIAYLDDGNRTMNLLQGKRFIKGSPIEQKEEKWLRRLILTKESKTYFTIYSDIENTNYRLIPNNFTSLKANRITTFRDARDVFFIGTNIDVYCEKIGLDIRQYWVYLKAAFNEVKKRYPHERIIYIPHGRDVNPTTETVCRENCVVFMRVDTSIECYINSIPNTPKAFFSYTSTALFTLKKMFPDIESYNILCDGMKLTPLYQTYIDFSNYFLKHGISLLLQSEINVSDRTFKSNL